MLIYTPARFELDAGRAISAFPACIRGGTARQHGPFLIRNGVTDAEDDTAYSHGVWVGRNEPGSPPASYDDPEAVRETSAGGGTQPASFDRGEYLPVEHRGEILKDWEGAGLHEPEEAYEWVRVGDLAYLINLTSGFIKDTASLSD